MKLKNVVATLLLTTAISNFSYADKVVAKYEGKEVYFNEVDKSFKVMIDGNAPEGKKSLVDFPQNVQENAVKTYIMGILIDDQIKKSKFKPSDIIDEKIALIKKSLIQREFLYSKMNHDDIKSKAKKLYHERFKEEDEYSASHILVKTEEEANKIYKEAHKNNEKFADFVKDSLDAASKANGGSLGYFTKGKMIPDFENAVFALNKGEIGKPVKTEFGWHVIRLDDKRKSKMPNYDDVKGQIIAEVEAEFVNNYVEQLLKDAKVDLLLSKEKDDEAKKAK